MVHMAAVGGGGSKQKNNNNNSLHDALPPAAVLACAFVGRSRSTYTIRT